MLTQGHLLHNLPQASTTSHLYDWEKAISSVRLPNLPRILASYIPIGFMESPWFIELGISFPAAISNEVQIEKISYQLVIRWLGWQVAGVNGARLVKPR